MSLRGGPARPAPPGSPPPSRTTASNTRPERRRPSGGQRRCSRLARGALLAAVRGGGRSGWPGTSAAARTGTAAGSGRQSGQLRRPLPGLDQGQRRRRARRHGAQRRPDRLAGGCAARVLVLPLVGQRAGIHHEVHEPVEPRCRCWYAAPAARSPADHRRPHPGPAARNGGRSSSPRAAGAHRGSRSPASSSHRRAARFGAPVAQPTRPEQPRPGGRRGHLDARPAGQAADHRTGQRRGAAARSGRRACPGGQP